MRWAKFYYLLCRTGQPFGGVLASLTNVWFWGRYVELRVENINVNSRQEASIDVNFFDFVSVKKVQNGSHGFVVTFN
jgi:hypothetical protein